MKFNITNGKLLPLLQRLGGIARKKQQSPILSCLLLKLTPGTLSITATDTELELIAAIKEQLDGEGAIVISAQKLLDICRNLSLEADLLFEEKENRILIRSGRSKFILSKLPSSAFPAMDITQDTFCFKVKWNIFSELIEKTRFAVAQQDVRHYLNGLLVEVEPDQLKVVATDGHRLALGALTLATGVDEPHQFIIPKKGVAELVRLLDNKEEKEIEVRVGSNFIHINIEGIFFTSKLIDGAFPNYQRVIPEKSSNQLLVDKEELKKGLARVAILANEQNHNVRLILDKDKIRLFSCNMEQEEAEEEIDVQYKGNNLEVGFNIAYLLDVLENIDTECVFISISDPNSGCLILPDRKSPYQYVVMPVRL